MVDENSLGPLGPNVTSVEPVSATAYSVQGHNFVSGYKVEVRDGTAQPVEDVSLEGVTAISFTLVLPYAMPGPYTLVVMDPDGRTSTVQFDTPGTSASNSMLRANS